MLKEKRGVAKMDHYLPTKTNLMKIQASIRLSKQGQELLEKKKYILQIEKEKYLKQKEELKKQIEHTKRKAFSLLQNANVEIGIDSVYDIARGIPVDHQIDIKYKTIMGVEIPSILYQEERPKLNYGLYGTTISVDEAILEFGKLKRDLIVLAGLENTIERLESSINKVQKRSNALKDIIIPQNKKIEKQIELALEEREREDFARLKIIKKQLGN